MPGLYIVATPIGNLGDISARAAKTLASAGVIAAEDTRVTAKLLSHLGLRVPMTPYHDHSDERTRAALVARMADEIVILVSDAGTPLISDPGYKLVRDARAAGRHGIRVLEVGDRRQAIREAVAAVWGQGESATVAVVGKGHESGQEIAGEITASPVRFQLPVAVCADVSSGDLVLVSGAGQQRL